MFHVMEKFDSTTKKRIVMNVTIDTGNKLYKNEICAILSWKANYQIFEFKHHTKNIHHN